MRVTVRSWLIRGFILFGVAALVALGWVANSWVSPERVREQVITTLNEYFDGVDVEVGSARMRILGGIAVRDLKLTRRGGPANQPFLVVPSAVLYHDKEQLNRGRLIIRKVDLENPEVRLERSADGQWNVAEVVRHGPADRPVPTFIAHGATLIVTDHVPDGLPPLRLTGARLTLQNDPLPVLTLHAEAAAEGFGPVEVMARLNRVTRHASIRLNMSSFPLGEVAPAVAGRLAPSLAPYLGKLAATASIKAELAYTPDTTPAWRHNIQVDVKDGRLEHPDLPWPVEKIAVTLKSVDGRVKIEEASAVIGAAQLKVALEARTDPPSAISPQRANAGPFARFEDHVQRAEVTVSGVQLDNALFDHLGEMGSKGRRMFSPVGAAEVGYKFTRVPDGWSREIEVRPQAARMTYEKFPFPVADIHGSVRRTVTHTGIETTEVDLRGKASGQQVTVRGQIVGPGEDPGVNLRVTGTGIPISDALIAALPGKYPNLIRQFRATGRINFTAEIAQKFGVNLFENVFKVEIQDGSVRYDLFPYQLEKVKGKVVVQVASAEPRKGAPTPADKDELVLSDFTAVHGGATIWLSGWKRPMVWFKLTDQSLDTLRNKNLPEVVLSRLTPLKDKELERADLETELARLLSIDEKDKFLNLILNHARPITGTPDRKLVLEIGGKECRIDDDLRKALSGLKADSVWASCAPRGNLTFTANVEALDRGRDPSRPGEEPPFHPASDLKLRFDFSGPTVTPSFFPYEVSDLSGWLEYKNGRVNLAHFAGWHGKSRLKLGEGEVRLYPDGVVWAELNGLDVKPLIAEPALLKAVPAKLRSAVEDLKLKGGVDLAIKKLVILTPPDGPSPTAQPRPIGPSAMTPASPRGEGSPGTTDLTSFAGKDARGGSSLITRGQLPGTTAATAGPAPGQLPPLMPMPASPTPPDPVVYWNAEIRLAGASIDTGVPWEELFGAVACVGRYEGTHLGLVVGNIWLDRAVVARQPVTQVKGHIQADPQKPDPSRPGQFLPTTLKFQDLSGSLFHGHVGGKTRVVLSDPVQYEVWLVASDVQLEEVARHYKLGSDADLKGVAQANLHLANRLDPRTGVWLVEGEGEVGVPTGRMYNLPVLLDLVKVFKLSPPDKTAFEEGHAVFKILGDRVRVEQIDLIGKAVCLGGSGEVGIDGDYVRFEFYTLPSQILARMVNTPVGDLSAFMSRNIFKYRLTRENGELRYRPEPVPAVTEPVRSLIERLRKQVGKPTGK